MHNSLGKPVNNKIHLYHLLHWLIKTTTFLFATESSKHINCFLTYPSEIAVFPTPGSPINTGLFFVLRERICIHLLISSSLPITGSSFPDRAMAVKSFPYFSKDSYLPSGSVTSPEILHFRHQWNNHSYILANHKRWMNKNKARLLHKNKYINPESSQINHIYPSLRKIPRIICVDSWILDHVIKQSSQ